MNKPGEVAKKQWIKAGIYIALYILFLIWVKSWMGIIIIPFIFDALITRIIRWDWWKHLKNRTMYKFMEWVDAIVCALVAVYFVNIFMFQNYAIPTSSLEKSLLIGDHLYVSKVAYGPRKPMTPLTMPLTQNVFPGGGKSYIDKPQWPYERIKGFGKIKQNEIVVFNYPAGDTLVSNPQYNQKYDYYLNLIYPTGRQIYSLSNKSVLPDTLTALEQYRLYESFYNEGQKYIARNEKEFGKIISRPVDRRENYVKRCVGLPGQTIEIKDGIICIDGVASEQPKAAQTNYDVTFLRRIPEPLRRKTHLNLEDLPESYRPGTYVIPLTDEARDILAAQTDIVVDIRHHTPTEAESEWLFPQNKVTHWTIDNYGPLWIPERGATIELTIDNLPFYERIIKVYEGNELEVKNDGSIIINGEKATGYTFKMDYYWMMGDNRQNSLDSRFWGFVPEDHIVGRPVFIWLSLDKDKKWGQTGKIRWNRMFRAVKNCN